ncbi:Uncharacterised protein [Bordetella pertussis]|nr:Uncharacterised protein [Bordetella pertussis]
MSQCPRWTRAFFSGIRRSSRMASPSTSSATERVLENGALKTGTPRIMAASRSTWLVPMQKHPTTRRSGLAASRSASRWVRERIPTTSAPRRASRSSPEGSAAAWATMSV